MTESFEMKDLYSQDSQGPNDSDSNETTFTVDGTLSLWSWTTAILITTLAAVFTLFPQLQLFLSQTVPASSTEYRTSLTPLESFLSTHFGLWLMALAASLVLNIPMASPPVARRVTNPEHPVLMPFTITALFGAFLSYNTRSVGSLASVYFFVTGVSGIWGLWALVFGGAPYLSKKTGADKRTSAFIFGNKSATSQQKKRQREGQKKP
ncbi:hypothetical protein E1B28_008920 [Marasmius oreades]|uniref:Uncharacterized protein n=1 Tax=Marasmius oreades TaxID=181124 RepID=A0A9P7RZZ5_9AGAR|nr:uncharacterized protein E1B28_008920 [Marasmius oreades]KAG7092572.1 hypothetical protein E1B28_008920 [Marasmius oreades]